VFITLYFLLDPIPYYKGIVYLVPKDREQRAVELLNNVRRIVVNWLGALIVSITAQATMVMITVGLIMQIPNALGLALLAGLSNIIPNLGFYLALIPVIVVTAAHDANKLPLVILFYIIGGEFEGKVITPRVVEHSLSLPAGLVLVFQLIAGAYLGFFGILLAVPILAIVMMLVKELYVFDALGKRGQLSELVENERGDLHLIKQNSLVADSE
jgi:predicted PurR-regulated permease PerM